MASAQVVETSVTNNSPSQDSNHPDDLFQSRYVTPRFKPFSYILFVVGHPPMKSLKLVFIVKHPSSHCLSNSVAIEQMRKAKRCTSSLKCCSTATHITSGRDGCSENCYSLNKINNMLPYHSGYDTTC